MWDLLPQIPDLRQKLERSDPLGFARGDLLPLIPHLRRKSERSDPLGVFARGGSASADPPLAPPVQCAGAKPPSPAGRAGACPRHAGAFRHRLRQRRLLDLLRTRAHRGLRARPDAARLRRGGRDLRRHCGHLRRGDGAVPRGRRLVQLRPARVQRARLVRRRLGADARLRRHRRHVGLLRPALPLDLLGAAAGEPLGHRRRHRRHRRARRAQHRRRPGGGAAVDHARGDRLRDAGAARRARLRARLQPADPRRQHPLGRRADLGEPRDRDPGGDARVHGGGDRLQPRRGGARPGQERSRRLQARGGSRSSRSTSRCR